MPSTPPDPPYGDSPNAQFWTIPRQRRLPDSVRYFVGLHLRVDSSNLGSEETTVNHPEMPAPEERGQTMAEYAVVLTVITIAIVTSLALLTSSVTDLLNQLIPLI